MSCVEGMREGVGGVKSAKSAANRQEIEMDGLKHE